MILLNAETSSIKKQKKKKNRYDLKSLLVYFLIFTLLFTITCIVSYGLVLKAESGADKDVEVSVDAANGIEITIPRGSSTSDIAEILKENGIIKWPSIFKLQSKINGYDDTYMSGKHIISKDLSYDQLMRVLSSNPVSINVTIREDYYFSQVLKALSDKKLIDKEKFVKSMNTEKFDYKFIDQIPDRENKLEGYLFPDTYFFDPNSTDREIITKFLDNFDTKFKLDYYARAKELKMTVDQVITLASIIEKEATLPEERSIISSVFHNRLKSTDPSLRKIKTDATIQYIIYKKEGKIKENLSEKDTKIDDPYNTYLYEGLPPGPICNPGLASIEAALYPDEESQYYYFVARGDGSHQFSKTLSEHEAATKKYTAKIKANDESEE
ncbi:endolytic transglycosylase MltG [Acetivibrio cellulolyticus]|uniref:endolytic transglycosylase MltG n=1 Tax=Acetivibrio cellulolyticus TaxID=35830 RepID=UPI00389939F9